MFTMLAIALCLAVMFLVLTGASVLSTAASRLLLSSMRSATPGTKANLLFALRLLPLALACVVTFGLALPSFLEFEPSSTKEGMGFRLIALAILGAVLLLGMMARGIRILHTTGQAKRRWRMRSERIDVSALQAQVYRVENGTSLLAVTGIFQPKIFIASEITDTLTPDELHAALAHEMAHISSLDNLKQFLLKITRAPRWLAGLQQADAEWTNASEIAADHNALAQGVSVLDLSSALIKVGRLKRPSANHEPVVASHLVPSACSGALESRITRLTEMLEGRGTTPARGEDRTNLFLPMMIALGMYLACIHAILPAVHEALELLVR